VTNVYKQLARIHGKANVGTEISGVDLVIKSPTDGSFIFFEFKTERSVRLCIREAVGQLLEYGFFRPSRTARKLVVVSDNEVTSKAKAYLQLLKTKFRLPIYYQRYDPETEMLDATEF